MLAVLAWLRCRSVQETRLDTARIRAARRMIDPIFLDTPLYRCEALERDLGCTVSIKLETANPVRSFKARGTEVVASLLADNGSSAAVCASAGNLGQALAWSGRGRGLDVTVVASRFAPAAKLDRIRALDARLELVDGDFDTARERAATIARYDGTDSSKTAWTSRPARAQRPSAWNYRPTPCRRSTPSWSRSAAGRWPLESATC